MAAWLVSPPIMVEVGMRERKKKHLKKRKNHVVRIESSHRKEKNSRTKGGEASMGRIMSVIKEKNSLY
ncbi:hypothetical protein SESBI_30350 [Sesbania bispinosa]|nr:hypothetical protein SESBI_30350 [Sesbania bispinosa]